MLCKSSVWLAIAADTDPLLPRVTCRMIPCPFHFAGNMCPNEYSEVVLEMVNQSFGMLFGISNNNSKSKCCRIDFIENLHSETDFHGVIVTSDFRFYNVREKNRQF